MSLSPLDADRLRRPCDPDSFGFETTAEVSPLEVTLGQPRALSALGFGLEIESDGYNIFATGPIGTGRRTTLEAALREHAAHRPAPMDRLYLFDFDHADKPLAVSLPSGRGRELAERMRQFVAEAQRRIPEAFESERYQEQRRELIEDVEHRRDEVLEEVKQFAAGRDLALELTPAGLVTIPIVDGKPVPPAEFPALPEAVRKRIERRLEEVEGRMPAALNRMRQMEREGNDRIRELDRQVALFAIGHLVEQLTAEFAGAEKLGAWLERAREDVIEHLGNFRVPQAYQEAPPEPIASAMRRTREDFFARYEPNLLVAHDNGNGAPVVFETNPTYYNLFGRIEYEATFGALSTDHRRIKAGALHRANGGYLMLDALGVLAQPFVWTKLKETLRNRKIEIETIGSQLTLFPTATLEPEPIELELKVILVGSPRLYSILHLLDEDLRKLFKVRADFALDMAREDSSADGYAAFIAARVADDGLLHFDRGAVARVVEHGARLAQHQGKLSTRFMEIADLVAESSHWARKAEADTVATAHVEQALEQSVYRSNQVEERIRELIAEGTLMIEAAGERLGQVNGLSVASLGDYEFGHPVRVSASSGFGGGDFVNIDRETELSGPIHDKGFLILSGFLGHCYGAERPLALRASIVFEQSYDEIEGDSASSAELCALLSSISEVPIRQGIAVTGSVNQYGRLQAIGGVNEKVEGFFKACEQAGLTGDQGVIVPAANVRHLMLRPELVAAASAGRFSVWAIETVDEAITLLTGVPAGERGVDGAYPEGTIHRRIEDRLDQLAALARQFGRPGEEDGKRSPPSAK